MRTNWLRGKKRRAKGSHKVSKRVMQLEYDMLINGQVYNGTYTRVEEPDEKIEYLVDTIFNPDGESCWDDELADKIAERLGSQYGG
jgi:hypothetical protein